MNVQQAIIVIMLTAVISIFIAMVTMSVYPDKDTDATTRAFHKLARTVMFGFVLIPWVIIVCLTDLYMQHASLRHDVTQNMTCS